LLERDPSKRIGGFKKGHMQIDGDADEKDDADDIRHHPFFNGVDWQALKTRSHEAPFKPKVQDDLDLKCIDKVFLQEDLQETFEKPSILRDSHIPGFSFKREDSVLKQNGFC
jgi:hypothetical protein